MQLSLKYQIIIVIIFIINWPTSKILFLVDLPKHICNYYIEI